MICQIHMGWFGKRPSALWYSTNKDGCCTQQHTWLKEFAPPEILLEMLLQENWMALLVLFTAEKMRWKDDQKRGQDKITVGSLYLCVAFCQNVHCASLWGGSDPLCVAMHCGCREASKGVPPGLFHLWLCSTQFFLGACAVVAAFFCNSRNVLMLFLFLSFCLSMKCIGGLWPYSLLNWENSALWRVQNWNFAHIFNILDPLKRIKETNGLRWLPCFSHLCVLGWCLKSIALPVPHHLFRDHIG